MALCETCAAETARFYIPLRRKNAQGRDEECVARFCASTCLVPGMVDREREGWTRLTEPPVVAPL